MLNSSIIFVFFRIINFFIILGFFLYLFKKYLLASIKEKLITYKNYFLQLQQNFLQKVDEQEKLNKDFEYQKEENQKLLNKIHLWNIEINNQKDKQIIEQQQVLSQIVNKRKIQSENLTLKKIEKDLFKVVRNNMQAKILKEFDNQSSALNYQKKVIADLK